MKDIQAWWEGLGARDRRFLLIGAALALPLLAWALVWQPLGAAREAARQAHAETAAQHAEVRTLTARLAATPATRAPGGNAGTQSPLAAVESVARDQRLLEQLKRREADGASGVRLVLENAPADALMRMLERLAQQHGLRVSQAQIEPATTGRVNASLTLQRGKP